jgi:membrane associated rhomboid family serine protease
MWQIFENTGRYETQKLLYDAFMAIQLSAEGFFKLRYYWLIITYMFVHVNFMHIFWNMLALFFVGPVLENRMGSWEFLTYYLVTGALAGLLTIVIYFYLGISNPLVGASGAIFALLLAVAVYLPRTRIFIFGILPVKAPVLVLVSVGISLMGLLTAPFIPSQGNRISHLAHLGGFIFGYLYFLIRLGIRPVKTIRDAYRPGQRWE